MNAVVQGLHGEIVDGTEFFAPASADLVDGLIGQYKVLRADIEQMAGLIDQHKASVSYFIEGNKQERARDYRSVAEIFRLEGAIGALNADFWQRALNMTDVFSYMPAKRREEWSAQIRSPLGEKAPRLSRWDLKDGRVQKEWTIEPLPDFEEETVRSTVMGLLNSRQSFFAERVDGIFQNLSGDHVTNVPQGFGKRMIIWAERKKDYITDLRQVVAKFMGRDDEPNWCSTNQLLAAAGRQSGKWMSIDGGSMRIRTYMKGTAHFEVHPEMAWKLNMVLASLHPMAIPAEFRQKPKKKLKSFEMMERPLPFAVLELLGNMKRPRLTAYRSSYNGEIIEPCTKNYNSLKFEYSDSKPAKAEAIRVLKAIGAVHFGVNSFEWFEFDYDPRDVLDHIITSGCIPDHVSHQFYPTPDGLAEMAVSYAEIMPGDTCLEPSAGTGSLAQFMPAEQTTCVEISALHCKVLEAKGFTVDQADFVKLAETTAHRFDKVVMNPPFSEGRAKAHTEAAASLVRSGGRLVAILPSGMRNSFDLPGWSVRWTKVHEDEFQGTTVDVVIMIADRD